MSEFDALPPGLPRLIADRYEIHSLIGRGGMADVYLATDHTLARKVAVKVLRQDTADNPMVVNRFRREAKSVAGLSHPNIVAVYDTGELPATEHSNATSPYIVMEYVSGRTLKQVLSEEQVDEQYAVELIRGVCDALDHSHMKNVVHRDIKPANIMLTDEGHVKLMDFGIARAMDTSATMTQTAAVVGTAQYFSPEQARGELVDYRSDIYSAGCLFYELVTHQPPFTGDSPVSVAYQHVGENPVPPSEVNSDLPEIYDPVVLKSLAKERDQRFQSAGAFATALEDAQNGIEYRDESATILAASVPFYERAEESSPPRHPVTSEHPVFSSRSDARQTEPRDHRSNRGLIWLLTIIALLAVGIASFLVIRSLQAEAEQRAPVAVPEVKNLSEEDATRLLNDATFKVNVEHEFSDDIDENKATRTDPNDGTNLPKDSTVKLFISDGSEDRVIPESLENQSEVAARDAIREAGLVVGEVSRENHPSIPTDWAIGTSPELGSKVKAGSTVDLILSTGMVKVPDITGMSRDEAEKALTSDDVGLRAQFLEVESDEEPGTLFLQDPVAGTEAPQGSLVKVSEAIKRAEPTPSETPTPSEPSDDSEESEATDEPEEATSSTPESSKPPQSTSGPGNGNGQGRGNQEG
ncbi:Stk1 family PASTA domain-containing Ser/Thr kinase [Glutamicibacter sp. AOP38-B1-38]|uniref:Stk1 family PASTA domain-containing Ser/Thr kinase n=1 Tax=Glutamicibacter sp. AOP38-B1-38 TaxID=3457680 RepID=UPI004033D577